MTVDSAIRSAAAPAVVASATIAQMFFTTLDRHQDEVAFRHQVGGQYRPITYREFYEQTVTLARALLDMGLKKGDRVGIVSENRPEWVYVDMACQMLGIVDVPVYPTLPSGQTAYILDDAATRVVVVDDARQLKKLLECWDRLPALETVVVIRPGEVSPAEHPSRSVLSFEDLQSRGKSARATVAQVRSASESVRPDEMATVIYTSGTTGDPKGAMLSHRNFLSNLAGVSTIIRVGPGDLFLSFAPLNHVFERLAGYYLPVSGGAAVAYPESTLRVKQNLPDTRPNVMLGVPRLYDGIKDGLLAALAKAPEKQRKAFEWAVSIGRRRAKALEARRSVGLITSLQWMLVDRLVLQKVRAKLGVERLRYFVSGTAPLSRDTAEFLLSIGIAFLEGWGLTETSPVLTVNRPEHFKIGSVGPAIPGVEMKVAEDGELLARGPNIMLGYLNKPEATAEAIDPDGWFHTGDVGRIDDDGFVYITDRKKDLIVLGTGKKVAPQPIEQKLKTSPYIQEIVVLGDRMSHCVALVVPAFDRLAPEAKKQGWSFENDQELAALPEVRKLLRAEIDRLSADLAEFEKIRQFCILDAEFSVEGGELTPTLKVKRKVIAQKYADAIRSLGA